jgi:hypothetical protein
MRHDGGIFYSKNDSCGLCNHKTNNSKYLLIRHKSFVNCIKKSYIEAQKYDKFEQFNVNTETVEQMS